MAPTAGVDDALITTSGRLIEAHRHLDKQLERSLVQQAGLPRAWFEVLLRTSRCDRGQISMGALAQQIALTSGGTTKLVDRMIEAGLVQRVPCDSDRRVSFAALTPRGQAVLDEASAVHVQGLRQAFRGFTAAELRTFDALLDRLRAATSEAGDERRR